MRFLWVPKTPKWKVPKKVPKRVDTDGSRGPVFAVLLEELLVKRFIIWHFFSWAFVFIRKYLNILLNYFFEK